MDNIISTKEAHGRRNTVIVPGTGPDDFGAAMQFVPEEASKPAPAT